MINRPFRLAVRTFPFHGKNTGSNPVWATTLKSMFNLIQIKMHKHLSELLNGAKINNIAKREKTRMNAIYVRIWKECGYLNKKYGTNYSTKVRDILRNREQWRTLLDKENNKTELTLKKPKSTNVESKAPKKLYELMRFNNALEAINNLEGDYRIGAILMYNTLNQND